MVVVQTIYSVVCINVDNNVHCRKYFMCITCHEDLVKGGCYYTLLK